ncbi:hypothetical protein [Clostridium estertheticum]|uniref:Uncharacterized protein n=1 Tax=Clostridium estertheticum TaxID=238834 RepID=A0A7Y3T2K5_9CLOT|nr:hypothetical protein [Clostridium estertheticum]NNU78139.1 hypothetical protein [Clostridium estertheticum]WBL47750.1 hypothetical protein LOR37_03405 [Clostridium estertheticum]
MEIVTANANNIKLLNLLPIIKNFLNNNIHITLHTCRVFQCIFSWLI